MAFQQSFFQNVRSSFGSNDVARSFTQGIGETFGISYKHKGLISGFTRPGESQGFLGRKAGGMFRKGLLGRVAFGSFLPFTVLSAYQGYQEGGAMGAATNVATSAISWGAIRAGLNMVTNPVGIGAAAVGAAGYGVYKLGEAARKNEKRARGLEMSTEVVDRFGTISTMRQRSLQAIQNSHLNGRSALGNEALLMSSPYMR